MWTRTALCYMAGLFEGEGTILVPRKNSPLRMRINSTDADVIGIFHTLAKVGTVSGPYKPSGLGKKLVYEFSVSGTKAYALAAALYIFLGKRRREQIQKAFVAYASLSHWRKLSNKDAADIKTRLMSGKHGIGRAIAREYHVSDGMISAIKHNRAWR